MAASRAVEGAVNPQQWAAAGDLFDLALAVPVDERTLFVRQRSGADDTLRDEVLSLLASHRAAGGFVQDRIKDAVVSFSEAAAGTLPARVGPYRLIRELGRGGMGTVYLAERDDDQYSAQVAVKLVRPGMDTEFILARFRRERQTLARLQHPNISRLLDGGTTDQGLPYIVMEYIDGPPLTVFADRSSLTVEQRLRLFLDVCAAVDYAHRNFVVHRDLKPGNILVAPGGIPKLVDFGICKLLQGDALGGETIATPMTPNYASPEQALGAPATALSDVYSLGAVLYELLAGTCPRHFERLTPAAIHEEISQKPIARPSAAARDRGIARQLAGDLDNIVMRALEHEPARRYESAARFADDLKRYLDHQPVLARPHTLGYRSRKYVLRHRGAITAVTLIVAALAAGAAAAVREARIADSRSQQIRALASKLVFDLHDAVRDLPGATRAREIIVHTGVQYLDSLSGSVRGDTAAERELARAYQQLGDIRGGRDFAYTGDFTGAVADYRKALALLDAIVARGDVTADVRAERLQLHNRMASMYEATGHLQDALQAFEEAIRQGHELTADNDVDVQRALAEAYLGASEVTRNMGNDAAAFEHASQALRLFEGLAKDHPSANVRHGLANAYASAGMSEMGLGRLDRALDHFRRTVTATEALVQSDAGNVTWNRELMLAYGHIGDVLGNADMPNLGDRAGALQAYQQAADIGRRLYLADRADLRAASDYGVVLSRVETVMDDGDAAAKIATERESLRVLDTAAQVSSNNLSLHLYRALVNVHLGDSLTRAGDIESARQAYSRAVAVARPYLKLANLALVVISIRANQRLALNAIRRGRRDEALDFARQALRTAEEAPASAPSLHTAARGTSALGLTYAALCTSAVGDATDIEQARTWLRKASAAWHADASKPAFAAPHQREMKEVDDTLARIDAAGACTAAHAP